MNDAAGQILHRVLDGIAERDRLTHEAIRAEIASKGTWWAASEIQRLRERIAGLERNKAQRR